MTTPSSSARSPNGAEQARQQQERRGRATSVCGADLASAPAVVRGRGGRSRASARARVGGTARATGGDRRAAACAAGPDRRAAAKSSARACPAVTAPGARIVRVHVTVASASDARLTHVHLPASASGGSRDTSFSAAASSRSPGTSRTASASSGVASAPVDRSEFGAGSGVAVVAIELHAIERDDQDLAPAAVDTGRVLVHVGDGKGEMRDVAVLLIDPHPLHVVPLVDGAIGVPEPPRIRVGGV